MKFSELWLREWVNPAIDSDALANQITMAGLEVDGVEPVAGSFHGVVVGEVVECAQHPNADKLRVTKVNVGGDRLLDIVCGAPNCRQGLRVAVATIGAVLPGDFKIKAAKLRGEPSEGMLCSFSELGISDDHSGIIELPVEYASSSSINLNSHEHHMIISSENLERCIISIEISEHNSTQKSLSDTPSRLFIVISLKPRSSAVLFLLRGYVVPASAHEPSGITSILSLQSASRVRSLVSI